MRQILWLHARKLKHVNKSLYAEPQGYMPTWSQHNYMPIYKITQLCMHA